MTEDTLNVQKGVRIRNLLECCKRGIDLQRRCKRDASIIVDGIVQKTVTMKNVTTCTKTIYCRVSTLLKTTRSTCRKEYGGLLEGF